MKIGVVIINWNGLNLLKSHLKTVIDYSENCTIYVIDNFSSDQSISYMFSKLPCFCKIYVFKNM